MRFRFDISCIDLKNNLLNNVKLFFYVEENCYLCAYKKERDMSKDIKELSQRDKDILDKAHIILVCNMVELISGSNTANIQASIYDIKHIIDTFDEELKEVLLSM